MSEFDRRAFLGLSAAALVLPELILPAGVVDSAFAANQVVYSIPKTKTKRFAWTVDDGFSSTALGNYLKFAHVFDLKFTFFMPSAYAPWYQHKSQIKDLLQRGQIQIGNHTHNHADLTRLNTAGIKKQLTECHNRIEDTWSYNAKPYFRPPFGRINQKVIEAAAEVGYTTPVLWYGTLADSGPTSFYGIFSKAQKYFQDGSLIIDHANNTIASSQFWRLAQLVEKRNLQTVTLREAFGR